MVPSRYLQLIFHGMMGTLSGGSSLLSRSISTSQALFANFYQVLGISQNATQGDIKAAYYKLSMLYHPDKNKDNVEAVAKFRAIAEAYEVLGNLRLKKLYDKGIIHTAGTEYSHMRPRYADEEVKEEPDDAQTKFYKAHMKKTQVPNASGRTPIYDFDEWSRAHYGASFERRKAAKGRYEKKIKNRLSDARALEMEFLIYGLALLIGISLMVTWSKESLDVAVDKNETGKPKEVEMVRNSIVK